MFAGANTLQEMSRKYSQLELAAGLILNVWLGLGVWDYSRLPGNILGQICPQYTLAWAALMVVAIKLENLMHKIADWILDRKK